MSPQHLASHFPFLQKKPHTLLWCGPAVKGTLGREGIFNFIMPICVLLDLWVSALCFNCLVIWSLLLCFCFYFTAISSLAAAIWFKNIIKSSNLDLNFPSRRTFLPSRSLGTGVKWEGLAHAGQRPKKLSGPCHSWCQHCNLALKTIYTLI